MEIYRSSTVELDEMVALADSKAPQPEIQVERPSSIFRPNGREQAESKIEGLMQEIVRVDRELDLDRRSGVPRDRVIAQEGARLRLSAQLERLNVQTVGDIGERFDPRQHHAIGFEPSGELDRGRILHVHQHGFIRKRSRFGVWEREELIQPAMVTVSSGWADAMSQGPRPHFGDPRPTVDQTRGVFSQTPFDDLSGGDYPTTPNAPAEQPPPADTEGLGVSSESDAAERARRGSEDLGGGSELFDKMFVPKPPLSD
jgi:hypothetical protein